MVGVPIFLIVISNLLINGGFEDGINEPAGWRVNTPGDTAGKVKYGKNVLWEQDFSPTGRCIKFLMNEKAPQWGSIAAITGIAYESDFIPVEYNKKYIIAVDTMGVGAKNPAPPPGVFVFIKGFKDDPVKGKFMVYQFQMECPLKGPNKWEHFESDFTVPKESIKTVKVILYTYYPEGIVWFDNVSLKLAEGK